MFFAVYFSPVANAFGWSIEQLARFLSFHFPGSGNFEVHQIITHMFMHGGTGHIIMNMLGLFFLGTYVEQTLGEKKFLYLYLLAGFGALLAHIIVGYATGAQNPVLGASGAVYGVVVAYATLYPNHSLMIIPIPVPIKAKWLAAGYIAYDLYNGLAGTETGFAHFAHLGGALTGFLLIRYWKSRRYS